MKEEIVGKAKKHFLSYISVMIKWCIIPLSGVLFYLKFGELLTLLLKKDPSTFDPTVFFDPRVFIPKIFGSIWIAVGILLFLGAILRLALSKFTISTKKVSGSYGLFIKKTLDVPINKVDSMAEKTTALGAIFKYSHIVVKSRASKYKFKYVANGKELLAKYYEAKEIVKKEEEANENSMIANLINK